MEKNTTSGPANPSRSRHESRVVSLAIPLRSSLISLFNRFMVELGQETMIKSQFFFVIFGMVCSLGHHVGSGVWELGFIRFIVFWFWIFCFSGSCAFEQFDLFSFCLKFHLLRWFGGSGCCEITCSYWCVLEINYKDIFIKKLALTFNCDLKV